MDTIALNHDKVTGKKYLKQIEKENNEILQKLTEIEDMIDTTNNIFNHITDKELIDGLIYELNALNKKHSYYIKICKSRGIINKEIAR